MASKKDGATVRGNKLVKKAIEVAVSRGELAAPEPVPAALVRKLKLPNGEALSPAMKELLAFDAAWLGVDYDEEEAEISGASLEEIIEETFGEDAVAAFAEAYEVLSEDCVAFSAELSRPACLYVGAADERDEYPVLTFTFDGGVAQIGGFVPFDVWVAQELGAVERGKAIGEVPAEYAGLPQELADANGDGRLVFTPKAGEAREDDEGDDEEGDEPAV